MKLLRKKAKVVEIRHIEKPAGNPLRSEINDLKLAMGVSFTQKDRLKQEIDELRIDVARLKNDRDTVFEVLKRPVTLFYNTDKEVMP